MEAEPQPSTSYAAAAKSPTGNRPTPLPPAPAPDAAAKQGTRRYPPLIVENLPGWTKHFAELAKELGHAPNARPLGKGVRFSPADENEYRIVQRYLMELEGQENIAWHSYSLKEDTKLKVAIRGLPLDTEPLEIQRALEERGFHPDYVRHIQARGDRPGCVFYAQFPRDPPPTPGIYDVKELLYMPGITIEAWRGKKGPPQCHRCQQFRHSSQCCHRPVACVRCGEAHFAKDCPRPRDMLPTCKNCGGPHPANHSSCPTYIREARNRRAGTIPRTTTRTGPPQTFSAAPTVTEMAPNSLMAPANLPTPRGAPIPTPTTVTKSSKRRNRRKRALTATVPQTRTPQVAPVAPAVQAATAPTSIPHSAPSHTRAPFGTTAAPAPYAPSPNYPFFPSYPPPAPPVTLPVTSSGAVEVPRALFDALMSHTLAQSHRGPRPVIFK